MGRTATDLTVRETYRVMLCSGECREWLYLGPDGRSVSWWQDVSSGQVFNEDSIMYSWQILEWTG